MMIEQALGLILVLVILWWQIRQQHLANKLIPADLVSGATSNLDTLIKFPASLQSQDSKDKEMLADSLSTSLTSNILVQPHENLHNL